MGSIQERIQSLSLQLVPFIMAVVFHEFARAYAADKCGDPTPRAQGRLTVNPVPHVDLFGTVLFPALSMLSGVPLLFGWARPVPLNPSRFKNYKKGVFWVSASGPIMNFILAVLSAFAYHSLRAWVPHSFYLFEPLIGMSIISVTLNFALGIFNLIPLPPLAGSKIVEVFLPYETAKKYEALSQYSFFILMGLLLTGALNVLIIPIRLCSELTLGIVGLLFSLIGF